MKANRTSAIMDDQRRMEASCGDDVSRHKKGRERLISLIEGTTFMDMFDPAGCYLFGENELQEAFADWVTEYSKLELFAAPKDTLKRFYTLVTRRPL